MRYKKKNIHEKRTFEQLLEHYKIEKELATRLRNSNKEKRQYLYTSLYDEMFERVPLHPMLIRKNNSKLRIKYVKEKYKLLKFFLKKEINFLEIGPGDCSLAFEVAKYVTINLADLSDIEIVGEKDFIDYGIEDWRMTNCLSIVANDDGALQREVMVI